MITILEKKINMAHTKLSNSRIRLDVSGRQVLAQIPSCGVSALGFIPLDLQGGVGVQGFFTMVVMHQDVAVGLPVDLAVESLRHMSSSAQMVRGASNAQKRLGSVLWRWFNFIPAWISNYLHFKIWDEITYPFLSSCSLVPPQLVSPNSQSNLQQKKNYCTAICICC